MEMCDASGGLCKSTRVEDMGVAVLVLGFDWLAHGLVVTCALTL